MANDTDLFRRLAGLGCAVEPCGSRVTCRPPPTDTDEDFLVVVTASEEAVSEVVGALTEAGYRWESSEHYQHASANGFMSWRKDAVNLIITSNADFAQRHRAATSVCKRLNLLSKPDRIAVFQAVLYGNPGGADAR